MGNIKKSFALFVVVAMFFNAFIVIPQHSALAMSRFSDFVIEQAHNHPNVYSLFEEPVNGDSLYFFVSYYYDTSDGVCTGYYAAYDDTGNQISATVSFGMDVPFSGPVEGDKKVVLNADPAPNSNYIYVKMFADCENGGIYYPTPSTLKIWRKADVNATVYSSFLGTTADKLFIGDTATIHLTASWVDDGTSASQLQYKVYDPSENEIANGQLGEDGTADISITATAIGNYKVVFGSGDSVVIPAQYYVLDLSQLNAGDPAINDGDVSLSVTSNASTFDSTKGVFTATPAAGTTLTLTITWHHVPDLAIPVKVKPQVTVNYCAACAEPYSSEDVIIPAHTSGDFSATVPVVIASDPSNNSSYAYARIKVYAIKAQNGSTWEPYDVYYWLWGTDFFDNLSLPSLPVGKGFTENISGILKVYNTNSWNTSESWVLGNNSKDNLARTYVYIVSPSGDVTSYLVGSDGSFDISYTFAEEGTYTLKGMFKVMKEIPVVTVGAATITSIDVSGVSQFATAPTAPYNVSFSGNVTRSDDTAPQSATLTAELLIDGAVVATQPVVVGFHSGENTISFNGEFNDVATVPSENIQVRVYWNSVSDNMYAYKHVDITNFSVNPNPAYVTQDIVVSGDFYTDYTGTVQYLDGAQVKLFGPDGTFVTSTVTDGGHFVIHFNPGEIYGNYTLKAYWENYYAERTIEVRDYEVISPTSVKYDFTEMNARPTAPFTANGHLTVYFATTTVPSKLTITAQWKLDETEGIGTPGPFSVEEEVITATFPAGVSKFEKDLSHTYTETPEKNVWVDISGSKYFYWRKFAIEYTTIPPQPLYVMDSGTLTIDVKDENGNSTVDYEWLKVIDPDGNVLYDVTAPPFATAIELPITFNKPGDYTILTKYGNTAVIHVNDWQDATYTSTEAHVDVVDAAGNLWQDYYNFNGQPIAPVTGTVKIWVGISAEQSSRKAFVKVYVVGDGTAQLVKTVDYQLLRGESISDIITATFALDVSPVNDLYVKVVFGGVSNELYTVIRPIWQKWYFENVSPNDIYINYPWTITGKVKTYTGDPALAGSPVYLKATDGTVLATTNLASDGSFSITYTFTTGGTYTLVTYNGSKYDLVVANVVDGTVTDLAISSPQYSYTKPVVGSSVSYDVNVTVAAHDTISVRVDVVPEVNIDGTVVTATPVEIILPAGVTSTVVHLTAPITIDPENYVNIGATTNYGSAETYQTYPYWQVLSITYTPSDIYQHVPVTITGEVKDYNEGHNYPAGIVVALEDASGTILATTTVASDGTFSIDYTFDTPGTYKIATLNYYYAEVSVLVKEAYLYTFSLEPGRWNLVSFPVTTTRTIEDIFDMGSDTVPSVYRLSGGTWYSARYETPKFGFGYFAKSMYTTTKTIEVIGIPTSDTQIFHASVGWNAVGNPFTHAIDFNKIDIKVGSTVYHGIAAAKEAGIVTSVFFYKNGTFVYVDLDADEIPVGGGFIIKLTQDADIIINP